MRSTGLKTGIVLLAGAATAIVFWSDGPPLPGEAGVAALSYEQLTGSLYGPSPKDLFRAPQVQELQLPRPPDATSVWGATGRDPEGHIWVGVSARSSGMSAHLLEYDPGADTWHDRGAVVDQLKAVGVYREGEGQIKIHSKIITADDGWLYFASTDEEGESPDGGVLPRWGGHIWRIDPTSKRWEHLSAVPEGLVAVNGVGRYLYALGYWNHVLYQLDTSTRALRRTVVGAAGGHVSRNLLVDARGHAYVPRLGSSSDRGAIVQLVEYDTDLREIAATPLEFYLGKGSARANHGIVGLTFLADGRVLFTTHIGYLYLIEPKGAGPATVTPVGWFHPAGEAYAPSLFSLNRSSMIAGVTSRGGRVEWVVFELRSRISAAYPLPLGDLEKVLLYGSISRDNSGRAYLVGWAADGTGGQRPLVLQVGAAAP
jgi:hypothetical protein